MLCQTESRAKRIQTGIKIRKLRRLLKQTNPEDSMPLSCLPFDSSPHMERDTRSAGLCCRMRQSGPFFFFKTKPVVSIWSVATTAAILVCSEGKTRSLRIFSKFSDCSFSGPAF